MIYSFDAYDWISQYHNITSFNNMHWLRKFFWCFDTFDWISQYHRITSYVIFHYIDLMEYHNITMSRNEITYLYCFNYSIRTFWLNITISHASGYCDILLKPFDWISQYHIQYDIVILAYVSYVKISQYHDIT